MSVALEIDAPPAAATILAHTRGLCAQCKRTVDARVLARAGEVFLDKRCPEHGAAEVLIASSLEWYLDALSFVAPSTAPAAKRAVERGCPHDCGPCSEHQQQVVMPVLAITSKCNLDCPICYTVNKNDDAWELSKEAFAQILEQLAQRKLDIFNFSGGEPTLHPELPALVRMAHDAGIARVAISTNGLKLKNEAFLQELAACDTRVVLSFDTFDGEVDKKLLGANTVKRKLEVLDLLERYEVTTTILPAIAAGLNDKEVPRLLELVLARKNIVSLELHTLTFTGQGGVGFDRSARITTPDLHRIIAEGTEGRIGPKDWVPSPLAHPHCYSISYLLMLEGGGYVPFTRFMSRQAVFELLGESLYIQPRERVEEALRDALDELWAREEPPPEGDAAESSPASPALRSAIMRTLKQLLRDMFPPQGLSQSERQKIAERATKAIYIHSHMDEESFELERIKRCSIGVPETDGSNIPVCAYNVLYREADPRFRSEPMLERMQLIRPAFLTKKGQA